MFKPYDTVSALPFFGFVTNQNITFDLDFGLSLPAAVEIDGFAPIDLGTSSRVAEPLMLYTEMADFLAAALFSSQIDTGHIYQANFNGCACCGHDQGVDAKAQINQLKIQIEALIAGDLTDLGHSSLMDAVAALGGVDTQTLMQNAQDVADTMAKNALSDAENEPANTDLPADTSTTGVLEIGSSVSGFRSRQDEDWFAVELEAGVEYVFIMLRDGDNPHTDPLLNLYDGSGTLIQSNDDIEIDGDLSSAENRNSMIFYTPTESGTFYVGASGYDFAGSGSNSFFSEGNYTIYAETSDNRPDFTLQETAFFLTHQFDNLRFWQKTDLTVNITELSDGAKNLARLALEAWAEVSGITFTEVTGAADISFDENRGDDDGVVAVARTAPLGANGIASVSITISDNWDTNSDGSPDYTLNSYRYQTYLHEIGHALGLGHGGPYNGVSTSPAGVDFNVYNQDAWNYTVMSYFSQGEADTGTPRFVLGLQAADILAVQSLYGGNSDTRTGDTVYGFNSTETGIFNFESTFFNQGIRLPSMAIFDSGGTDTLDFSGYVSNQTITLIEGQFLSVGDNTVTSASDDAIQNNMMIAFGTVIENAIGGSGNDIFIGNDADNIFTGNGGNDTYDGGAGIDTVVLASARSSYTISEDNSGQGRILVIENAQDGMDRIDSSTIEFVSFGNGAEQVAISDLLDPDPVFTNDADTADGTGADDFYDAQAGDDILNGLAGNDTLIGNNGADQLDGGADNDTLLGDSAFALTGFQGEIYRAYQAVFDRDPDEGGFNAYLTALQIGNSTVLDMFEDFVSSQEFQNTYGDLTDAEFVDLAFTNILPGNMDQVGRDSYTADLAAGRLTRAEAIADIANSLEFRELTRVDSAAFGNNFILNPQDLLVYSLYQAVFGRAPDAGGYQAYTGGLQVSAIDGLGIATDFVGSAEFQATYGDLSNSEFVELLFTNVLPGNEDQQGRDSYKASLDSGALTRTEMVLELATSFEFRVRIADDALEFAKQYNLALLSDTIIGGTGNDLLFGGTGRDRFLFDGDGTGEDVIMDFVAGVDIIELTNVTGFTTFAEVLAAATQVGQNTVIALSDGNSITLRNVTRDSLTEDDFGFGSGSSAKVLDEETSDLTAKNLDGFDTLIADTAPVMVVEMDQVEGLEMDMIDMVDFHAISGIYL